MRIIPYSQIPESFWQTNATFQVIEDVIKILERVQSDGDAALIELTQKYDGVVPEKLCIQSAELESYVHNFTDKQLQALQQMKENLISFARRQKQQFIDFTVQNQQGVQLGQRVLPIEKAGIYVPGGNYPLVSTVLMCVIPAKVAGVSEIVLATPPDKNGTVNPYIAGAAYLAGVDRILLVGGAQAIAAFAYGTETIPKVDIIVGPGNAYVTEAKRQVSGMVGIDFIAGPSEIMIIADDSANPCIIAADLLAQAEHDVMASSILVTDSADLALKVDKEITAQLKALKTREIAEQAINRNGCIILVDNMDQAVEIANKKAPEHLELQVHNSEVIYPELKNYGSLFIGQYAGEILGDYSAGINHTLPTAGAARYTSGLSVANFLKLSTTLQCTQKGFDMISDSAAEIAKMEGLHGHYNAIIIRKNH